MSIVPEFIFQTTISRGIATLRKDSRYIDQLFRNLSRGDREQMRAFIQSNTIDLAINYPRSALSLPAIVILLRTDNESTAFLDDYMAMGNPDEFSYDGGIEGEILGGTTSTSNTSGPSELVFGPHRVLSATLNTLRVSDRTFYVSQFVDGTELLEVHIVSGTGSGQVRKVVANSHNYLMTDTNWTIVPDTTSVFEIRTPRSEIVGQPPLLYNNNDFSELVERRGGVYTNRYQVQVVATTQEQVIYLYAILKAIFTLSRLFMEGQGVINLRMSGTDFINRPEYVPDMAYMRMMTVEFENHFDVYQSVGGLVENFTLCLIDGIDGVNANISEDPVDLTTKDPTITGP